MSQIQNYRELLFTDSAVLGANGTFTSGSFDTSLFGKVKVRAYSDQAGTLKIEQSDDGVTWDTVSTTNVAAGVPSFVSAETYLKFCRIEYDNGATVQTAFRLSGYGSAL